MGRRLKKVRLIWHRIFQPGGRRAARLRSTIEATLKEMKKRLRATRCVMTRIRCRPWRSVLKRRRADGGISAVAAEPDRGEHELYELIGGQQPDRLQDAGIRLAI